MANISNEKNIGTQIRLAWIEREAAKRGVIRRGDVSAVWGMSNQQVSADFAKLLELNPGCLVYDLRAKNYVWNGKKLMTEIPSVVVDLYPG